MAVTPSQAAAQETAEQALRDNPLLWLRDLATETGGRYYKPNEASRLGKDINYSEAGITIRETRDLWDMPIIFLVIVLLRAAEWLLRRKWGVI